MVWMWIVLAAVVLVAVLAFVATVFRRPRGDDLNSVRSYHSALGTLEHISERTIQPSGSAAGPAAGPVPAPADGSGDPQMTPRFYSRQGAEGISHPPGDGEQRTEADDAPIQPRSVRSAPPLSVGGGVARTETPLVFDDARPSDGYRRTPSREGTPGARTDRVQRHALDSMNHRPRRGASLAIVIVALVVFGALAYVGSRRSHTPNHANSVRATTSTTAQNVTSPTGAGSSHQGGSTAKSKGKTKTTTSTPAQVIALSSTPGTAIYPVNSSSYQLTISATGPCWVSATTASTGSTLWTGTLQAGAVQPIQASGIVKVELGSTSASVTLNGKPVVFPTPMSTPFIATFDPTAASSTGATTSTTSPTSGSSAPAG
jgi:Domain of unknown function (DUF4115)